MGLDAEQAKARVIAHLRASADLKRQVADGCSEPILRAAELIVTAFRSGGKLLLCGNGGSAADCQHMAAELVGRMSREVERPGLPAIALTANTSALTALANDFGYDSVFEGQVRALGRPGDVLMAISTSGDSSNVIRAVDAALSLGLETITLTGYGGGLATRGTVSIAAPGTDTQLVQEAHLAIEHILCDLVERRLAGAKVRTEAPRS